MIWIALVVLILFSFYSGTLYYFVYRAQSWWHGTKMPVVTAHPGFGIMATRRLVKHLNENTMLEFVSSMAEGKSQTILDQRLFQWSINTSEPDNIKAVLSTKFKDYSLGLREPQIGKAFGSGIFTLSGEGWKHSRNMLRPQFSRDQVSQLGSVTMHVNKLISGIDRLQAGQKFVDAQDLFHQLTIDTATEFLFGESLECLEELNGGRAASVTFNGRTVTAHEFVESYMFMLHKSVGRTILGPFYMFGDSLEFRRHISRARVVVDYYVERALAESEKHNGSPGYVFSHELAKVTRDPVVIRDQIFNILIAGRDTTAVTMSFIAFHLSRNPAVTEKLRRVVLEEFGTAEENRPITFEMLRGCKYLNAVINEVLRLEPVVPLNFRTAVRDTVLPTGGGPNGDQPVLVPKGMPVTYQPFTLHRLKGFWGEDADEFNPERWIGKVDVPMWAYIPFNGGPRICLGQQFALTELALTWVRLMQTYSRIVPGAGLPQDPVHGFFLTIKFAGNVDVRFERDP